MCEHVPNLLDKMVQMFNTKKIFNPFHYIGTAINDTTFADFCNRLKDNTDFHEIDLSSCASLSSSSISTLSSISKSLKVLKLSSFHFDREAAKAISKNFSSTLTELHLHNVCMRDAITNFEYIQRETIDSELVCSLCSNPFTQPVIESCGGMNFDFSFISVAFELTFSIFPLFLTLHTLSSNFLQGMPGGIRQLSILSKVALLDPKDFELHL